MRGVRLWWWTYALLIVLPALALALLGWRAVRAARIERERQERDRQTAVARVADAAIGNALAGIEAELRSGSTGGRIALVYDRRGLLQFPGDRVHFADFGLRPDEAAPSRRARATAQLVEQAQAAEARGKPEDAAAAYRKVAAAEPRLREWAELGLARSGGQPVRVRPRWWRPDALSPAGVPVALLACALNPDPALLSATLKALRSGLWPLSYEERRFHDAELRRGLGGKYGEDSRLEELAAVARSVRRAPPSRRDGPTRVYERQGTRAFLLLWTPARPETWTGTVLTDIPGLVQAAVAPLAAPAAAVLDGGGQVLWGRAVTGQAETLLSVPAWNIILEPPPPARGTWLWYGFILLLIVILGTGLAMTARVVRREMELGRLQSEFVAAVTHEFKSPLTSIRLLVERIAGGRLHAPAEPARYCAAITRETDRLERLVNRILEAQRIQAGRREYDLVAADVAAIATQAIERLRPQAEAAGVGLELDVRDPPPVELDPAAIADAVENLLDNAIKYSPAGAHVLVSAAAAGGEVQIEVRDQGAGIAPADLPHIFDRFYRGRSGVQGSGLGLALVKAAAEAHGGRVEVDSAPGRGSRFRLCLPVSQKERTHA